MAELGNQDFPTTLGQDANFKGELSFEKGLRLHGKFEGRITSPGRLHVAKEARVTADVEVGSVVVEGEIKGNLVAADKVEFKNSARYEGDLRASKLVVDEGAVFSGNVSVGPEAVKNRPAAGSNTSAGGAGIGGLRPAAMGAGKP